MAKLKTGNRCLNLTERGGQHERPFSQCRCEAVYVSAKQFSGGGVGSARGGLAASQCCHLACELHGMSPIPITENNIDFFF